MRVFFPLVALCLLASACDSTPDPRQTNFIVKKDYVTARYDDKSGRLKKLEVDLNKNGVMDTWQYMDGTRVDRIEIDKDENGKIERWEHYKDGKLESVGSSSRGDGVEDEWAFPGPTGILLRVEADTDRDGKVDKWSTYEPSSQAGVAPVLRSVDLDPDANGRPTHRLLYRADGSFERSEMMNNSAK